MKKSRAVNVMRYETDELFYIIKFMFLFMFMFIMSTKCLEIRKNFLLEISSHKVVEVEASPIIISKLKLRYAN